MTAFCQDRRAEPSPATRAPVVAASAGAGWRAGVCLGAAFGASVLLFTGFAPVAILGAVVGGVLGGPSGLVVGVLNGVVLQGLADTAVLHPGAPNLTGRATTIAVLTTGTAVFAARLVLLGWLSGGPGLFSLAYLPVTAASALVAAALGRRLPPANGHERRFKGAPVPGGFSG